MRCHDEIPTEDREPVVAGGDAAPLFAPIGLTDRARHRVIGLLGLNSVDGAYGKRLAIAAVIASGACS